MYQGVANSPEVRKNIISSDKKTDKRGQEDYILNFQNMASASVPRIFERDG